MSIHCGDSFDVSGILVVGDRDGIHRGTALHIEGYGVGLGIPFGGYGGGIRDLIDLEVPCLSGPDP